MSRWQPAVFIPKYFCKTGYYTVFSINQYWQQVPATNGAAGIGLPDKIQDAQLNMTFRCTMNNCFL